MDWKLFVSTFAAIFVAELGDKTQLAALGIASEAQHGKLTVFLASASALAATSAVAVLGAGVLTQYVSPLWLKRAAGVLFLVLGAWTLLKAGD